MATLKTQLDNVRKENRLLKDKMALLEETLYNQMLNQNRYSAAQNAISELLISKETFTREEITEITTLKIDEADKSLVRTMQQHQKRQEAQQKCKSSQ